MIDMYDFYNGFTNRGNVRQVIAQNKVVIITKRDNVWLDSVHLKTL